MPAASSSRDRSASPEPRRRDEDRRDRDRTRDDHKSSRHRRSSRDEDDEERRRRSKSHHSHRRRHDGSEDDDEDDEVGPRPPFADDEAIDPRVLALGASGIDEEDFYQKAAEFKHWLRSSKHKYLDELSSREARRYFDKFAKRWNRGELDDAYYKGEVRTAGASASSQTRHKWGFTSTKLTKQEQDLLETTRDNVDTLTNANSRGAIEAREAERRLGKGKRMTERDGEVAKEGSSRDRDHGEGTSANAGAKDSGWGVRPPARMSDTQFDREERQERDRRTRQAETRKERRDMKEDLDELAPKATGREALIEKKREARQSHRAFANRKDGDDGFDMDDGVIMGANRGGDDFRSAVAERDRTNARQRERAEQKRVERQAENGERFSALKQKESDTMAMFKAMAQQRFGPGGHHAQGCRCYFDTTIAELSLLRPQNDSGSAQYDVSVNQSRYHVDEHLRYHPELRSRGHTITPQRTPEASLRQSFKSAFHINKHPMLVVPPALNAAADPVTEDWDNDDDFDFSGDAHNGKGSTPVSLRRPLSFASDVDIYEDSADHAAGHSSGGDFRGPASITGSASSRTSRSGMSSSAHTYRSTDLTDPEGSPMTSLQQHSDASSSKKRMGGASLSPQRAYDTRRPLSTSPTSIDRPYHFQRHTPSQRQAFNEEGSSEHELDFELGDGVQQLHLAPSTIRKRPSTDLWERVGGDLGTDAQSRADQSAGSTSKSPAPSHRSFNDSDNDGALGDDESEAAETMEDGLDLPDSLFGKVEGTAHAAAADIDINPSARLRALLDARLRGQHLSAASTPSRLSTTSTSERLAGGALDFDADTDVVTGLVITDDLDLSPSRLVAKSLSFKTRRSVGGSGMSSHTIPRSQQTPIADRQRPSGSNARTWTSSPSGPLPTLVLTNSSPASHDRTAPAPSTQRSPPRALSSYSHAPGGRPRSLAVNRADSLRSSSPTSQGSASSSRQPSSRAHALLSPDSMMSASGFSSNLSQQQQRNQSLVRKRSMPALSDASAASSAAETSTSAALSAVHASITANTSALSRLMASTASSRAREAETAARMAARGPLDQELHGEYGGAPGSASSSMALRIPPSRPSTPVNGAVRYTLNTSASRIRRLASGAAAGAASAAAASIASGREGISGTGSPRPGSVGRGAGSMYSAITASAAAAKDAARVMRRPTRPRNYGDGNELDAFDDLPTNQEVESRFRRTPLRQASSQTQQGTLAGDETLKVQPRDLPHLMTALKDGGSTLRATNASKLASQNAVAGPSKPRPASRAETAAGTSAAGSTNRRRSHRGGSNKTKKPTLIRNLGGNAQNRSRVVGDMRWNPAMQRWEGNESALRAFDNVVNSSTRPALISPLTTSSVSSLVSSASSLLGPSTSTLGGMSMGASSSTIGKSALTMTGLAAATKAAQAAVVMLGPRLKHSASSAASMSTAATNFVEPQGSMQGTRVVGDMMFDPVQMCWLSMVGNEEPDVFAGIGEEDEEGASSNGEQRDGISSSSAAELRRMGSGLTGAGAWSSGWGGLEGRAGRSSTAPTTDEDEDEVGKGVGCSDTGAVPSGSGDGAPPPLSPLLGVEGIPLQQQGQTMTARRIRSADLLRPSSARGGPSTKTAAELSDEGHAARTTASSSSPSIGVDAALDDEELQQLCLEAEGRHRKEVRGFLPKGSFGAPPSSSSSSFLAESSGRPSRSGAGGGGTEVDPRSHLYLLQRLAREACR
ncbi:hypothetical protein V8E36_007943 [Tilletia maclaganii]